MKEVDAGFITVAPDDQSDYQQFASYAKQNGCQCQGIVGFLPDDKSVRVETWIYPDWRGQAAGRFLLLVGRDQKIGVFEMVGKDGAPLVRDIEWLHGKLRQRI